MSTDTSSLKGGCLCGNIRYEICGTPKQINLCHCSMCQKFSGSSFGAFMYVESKDFTFTKGREQIYDSSDWAARGFCARCGSSLRYINKQRSELVCVAAGPLDEAPGIVSRHHRFMDDRAPWFYLDSTIPRFPDWKSSVTNNVKW